MTSAIDAGAQQTLCETASSVIASADMLVLSDYAKGCLPETVIRQLIDAARAAKKLIVADPKVTDLSVYADVDILTPNLQELSKSAGTSLTELDTIGATATRLAKTHHIGTIMTTLSARGILASSANGTQFHDPAKTRDVFDVSGAGDTVVAVISAAIASGAQSRSGGRASQSRSRCCGQQIRHSDCHARRNSSLYAAIKPVNRTSLSGHLMSKLAQCWR